MILTKLLVAALILGLFPKTNQPQKTEFTYVSLGASQTTGYGLHGFVPEGFYDDPAKIYEKGKDDRDGYYSSGYYFYSEKAYPVLIKEKLEDKYDTVHFYQNGINSMRAYDLAYLLDENVKADGYTKWRLEGKTAGKGWINDLEKERHESSSLGTFDHAQSNLREEFKDRITAADLITFDFGINDFTVYLSNMLIPLIDGGEPLFDCDLKNTLGEEYGEYYYQIKNLIYEVLFGELEEPFALIVGVFGPVLDFIIDTLAYTVTSFIYGFETSMAKIYELNPDVEVVVVGIQNILKGIKVKLLDYEIDAGMVFGIVTSIANFYMSHLSKFSDKYYYADFGEKQRATTFLDEIVAWDGDPENIPSNVVDAFDVYEEECQATADAKKYVAGLNIDFYKTTYDLEDADVDALTEKLVDYVHFVYATTCKLALKDLVIDLSNLDLNAIKDTIMKYYETKDAFDLLASEYHDGDMDTVFAAASSDLFSKFGNPSFKGSVGAALVLSYANSFFSHPNEEGHEEIAELIWKAFTEKKIARYDFVYAAIEISVALAKIALQKAREMTLEAIAALDNLGSVTLVKIAEIKEKIEAARAYILEKQAEAKASMEASFAEAFDKAYETLLEELDEAMEKANSLSATVKENIHTSFDNLWSYLLGILNR